MKYNNLFIALALCASFAPQTNLCMENAPRAQRSEGWGSWAGRQMGYITSAASSLMSRTYNTIGGWSTTTKTTVFLLTAAALIALGIDKDTLKQAIDTGISGSGQVLQSGIEIIKEYPKMTMGIGAIGTGIAGTIGLSQLKNKIELGEMREKASHWPISTTISEYVTVLNDLVDRKDNNSKDDYQRCIENLCSKFEQLIDSQNLQSKEYEENSKSLGDLKPMIANAIVSSLKNNYLFWEKFKSKMAQFKIQENTIDNSPNPLQEIFNIIYESHKT